MLKKYNLNEIKPNPKNPRYFFDVVALEELAETIKKQGVIHPIEIDENNMIICGERRWRASLIAGLKTIPCTVKRGLTDFEKLQRQYIENAQHRDLNIVEKGRAFKNMLVHKKKDLLLKRDDKHKSDYHSKGIKELADQIGETSWTIREAVCLIDEEKIITEAIENAKIPYTHIIQANKIQDESLKKKVKEKILDNDFPSREILKETIELLNEHPEYTKNILSKKGDDIKEELNKIIDADLITRQDLKKTALIQAFPFIEDEYKKFNSTNLARFIEHLEKLIQ